VVDMKLYPVDLDLSMISFRFDARTFDITRFPLLVEVYLEEKQGDAWVIRRKLFVREFIDAEEWKSKDLYWSLCTNEGFTENSRIVFGCFFDNTERENRIYNGKNTKVGMCIPRMANGWTKDDCTCLACTKGIVAGFSPLRASEFFRIYSPLIITEAHPCSNKQLHSHVMKFPSAIVAFNKCGHVFHGTCLLEAPGHRISRGADGIVYCWSCTSKGSSLP